MGGRGGGSSIASRAATPSVAPVTDAGGQMQADILRTYQSLSERFDNMWVGLSELRAELGGSKDQQDKALIQLVSDRKIRLIPEENQKTITPADAAAAINLSGELKHLIGITR